MKQKLLFFDIDGTLVNFEGEMPESTREALRRAREQGHKLVICTGRSRQQVYDWLEQYGFDGYICASGAYVEYEGKVISHRTVDAKALAKLVDYFEKEHIIYCFQAAEHTVTNRAGMEGMVRMFADRLGGGADVMKRIIKETLQDEDLKSHTETEKMVYYESPVCVREVAEQLAPEFEVAASSFEKPDETSGEVTMTGINKKREDTIAFGDGPNDLDMLEYAGIGVCMGNAMDYVKETADMITDHINEDGILHAMEKLKLI